MFYNVTIGYLNSYWLQYSFFQSIIPLVLSDVQIYQLVCDSGSTYMYTYSMHQMNLGVGLMGLYNCIQMH